jgi:hypothetical protein
MNSGFSGESFAGLVDVDPAASMFIYIMKEKPNPAAGYKLLFQHGHGDVGIEPDGPFRSGLFPTLNFMGGYS